jgi:hypothetical protein
MHPKNLEKYSIDIKTGKVYLEKVIVGIMQWQKSFPIFLFYDHY